MNNQQQISLWWCCDRSRGKWELLNSQSYVVNIRGLCFDIAMFRAGLLGKSGDVIVFEIAVTAVYRTQKRLVGRQLNNWEILIIVILFFQHSCLVILKFIVDFKSGQVRSCSKAQSDYYYWQRHEKIWMALKVSALTKVTCLPSY